MSNSAASIEAGGFRKISDQGDRRSGSRRIASLDGLRGMAAVIVLIHHAFLLVPALADPLYTGNPATFGSWAWWLSHTPLAALWEGKAAVYVFFILSGLVLAKLTTTSSFTWASYYPQRLARLYIPVWGAVLFTVLTYFLLPRTAAIQSPWLEERPTAVTGLALIKDLTLLAGNGGLASPLWSLRFEILFSLTLPVYIWVTKKYPQYSGLKVSACLATITLGGCLNSTMLTYAPMFLLGTIMVTEQKRLQDFAELLNARRWGWPMIFTASLFLLSSQGVAAGFLHEGPTLGSTVGLKAVGASLVVLAAIHNKSFRRVLERRPMQWLAMISFSLYLIHEPIVVGFGFYFTESHPVLAIGISIIVALPVAWIFYMVVEKPSHKLSKLLGTT